MNEQEIRERLRETKEQVSDPVRQQLRAREQMKEERRLMLRSCPNFDWVWEWQPEKDRGFHVGPNDPDWSYRNGGGWR